jgi:hypothetical protein
MPEPNWDMTWSDFVNDLRKIYRWFRQDWLRAVWLPMAVAACYPLAPAATSTFMRLLTPTCSYVLCPRAGDVEQSTGRRRIWGAGADLLCPNHASVESERYYFLAPIALPAALARLGLVVAYPLLVVGILLLAAAVLGEVPRKQGFIVVLAAPLLLLACIVVFPILYWTFGLLDGYRF